MMSFSSLSFGQFKTDKISATLVHGNNTIVYYGKDALSKAYKDAAEKGDIITLSSGTFSSINIYKSISIYGVGFETNPITGEEPTIIQGGINIYPTKYYDEEGEIQYKSPTIHLEGFSLSKGSSLALNGNYPEDDKAIIENLTVRKCKIWGDYSNYLPSTYLRINANTKNCKFIQCVLISRIRSSYSHPTAGIGYKRIAYRQEMLTFDNCWLQESCGADSESTVYFNHCLIKGRDGVRANTDGGYTYYYNNIIMAKINTTSVAFNNIFTDATTGTDLGQGNIVNVSTSSLFSDNEEDGNYGVNKTFDLLKPNHFLGTDDTEIGLYGGTYPFSRISPIPSIQEADVSFPESNGGNLNVRYKAEAHPMQYHPDAPITHIASYAYWFNHGPRVQVDVNPQNTLVLENLVIEVKDVIPNQVTPGYEFDVSQKMVKVKDDVFFGIQAFDNLGHPSSAMMSETFPYTVEYKPEFLPLTMSDSIQFEIPHFGYIQGIDITTETGDSIILCASTYCTIDLYDANGASIEAVKTSDKTNGKVTYKGVSAGGKVYALLYDGGQDSDSMTVVYQKPQENGDVNEDDNVDISDIVAIINQIAGTATYKFADVNNDKKVDISDIVAIINIIASK